MKRLILCVVLFFSIGAGARAEDPLKFLKEHVGKRVGGGECSHMVDEALRVWGKEFFSQDPHKNGDYVWGTLVKQISKSREWQDSAPNAKAEPGDVIQYRNAALGSVIGHHTSMIAAVDQQGYPTHIYEQNVGSADDPKKRTVQLSPIDLTKLTGGTVWIYRPKNRQDAAGKYTFAVINNAGSKQKVEVHLDKSLVYSTTLDTANTLGSYRFAWVSGSGVPTLRLSDGKSVALENAGGYEVYQSDDGSIGIRKLNP